MKLAYIPVKPIFVGVLLACTMAIAAPKAKGSDMSNLNKDTDLAKKTCPALLQGTYKKLQDDSPQSLCQFSGQVVLVVNTASYCGFTRQYDGLERLYERYKSQGFVVLGFPSNDFGQQEPESKTLTEAIEKMLKSTP